MTDILLITPPFTQLNTPYPATPYLKGFLNTKGISSFQMDLGIEVIQALFTKKVLSGIFDNVAAVADNEISGNSRRILSLRLNYINTIEAVIAFLQGKNSVIARQICSESYLPQASRFDQLADIEWAFGNMGFIDKAKHLATLYLEDLSDFLMECVDSNFGFSRYAERLGRSANSFDELYASLHAPLSLIDTITLDLLKKAILKQQPKLLAISVPFPGNLFSAFRCAQYVKQNFPDINITMGGGFPNTELRSLTDKRVFEFFDFITLDDGELPLELLITHIKKGKTDALPQLCRTYQIQNDAVFFNNSSDLNDYAQKKIGTPDYADLNLDNYISVIEVTNPMHSLWSDGKWIKLTMAHGCYWGKCTFCDGSLPYIKHFEPSSASMLVDRMEQLIKETGETGFHFVDEAAPPALMKALALEIIKRNLSVTWWTNVRFEKSFTRDFCLLLKASGCIAVSGGLEVASNRLLKLINKGVSIEQVANITRNLTECGIMVHAYLMYGFPSQTIQETIDSLEMVRQLFENGLIESGYWHQFALTAHSPVGLEPDKFQITPHKQSISFADNDVQFTDNTGINHDKFSFGLKKALFNYMHGIGFDMPAHEWFNFKVPRTKIEPDFINNALIQDDMLLPKEQYLLLWSGSYPTLTLSTKKKKGQTKEIAKMLFHSNNDLFEIVLPREKAVWLQKILPKLHWQADTSFTFGEVKLDFEQHFDLFEAFWFSKPLQRLRGNGLIILSN